MPESKTNVVKTQSIETVFIKEFVRQMIINSKPKPKVDREIIERVKAKLSAKNEMQRLALPIVENVSSPVIRTQQRIPLRSMNSKMLPSQFRVPQSKNFPGAPRPQQIIKMPERKIKAPSKEPLQEQINLGKLRAVFLDPKVTGIECQGPGKNLLINRSGLIQNSQLTLSESEINEILQDFSHKTKIPLIPGIFKALYNNMLITAILSEGAGNRFIIEKHFGQPSLPKKEDVK